MRNSSDTCARVASARAVSRLEIRAACEGSSLADVDGARVERPASEVAGLEGLRWEDAVAVAPPEVFGDAGRGAQQLSPRQKARVMKLVRWQDGHVHSSRRCFAGGFIAERSAWRISSPRSVFLWRMLFLRRTRCHPVTHGTPPSLRNPRDWRRQQIGGDPSLFA